MPGLDFGIVFGNSKCHRTFTESFANMKQYQDLLQYTMDHGVAKSDRTGTGTRSVFGHQMRFDLKQGFPLVTTKFVPLRLIISELLWFLRGDTNIKYLLERNNHIWDEWANANGDLGPVYGAQWRSWPSFSPDPANPGRYIKNPGIDQIQQVMDILAKDPDSRRIIVTAWNPAELPQMALSPCHAFFQFYVANNTLSCQLYQRSADMFLGVPFNIASYAALVHMMAQQLNMAVGEFVWTGGDIHIYDNHVEQVNTQLARAPYALPTLAFKRKPESIFDYQEDDFVLLGYNNHPAIKAPVAV